jgi:hypothetical protein
VIPLMFIKVLFNIIVKSFFRQSFSYSTLHYVTFQH